MHPLIQVSCGTAYNNFEIFKWENEKHVNLLSLIADIVNMKCFTHYAIMLDHHSDKAPHQVSIISLMETFRIPILFIYIHVSTYVTETRQFLTTIAGIQLLLICTVYHKTQSSIIIKMVQIQQHCAVLNEK